MTSPRIALTWVSALAVQSATSTMLACAAVVYSSCSTNQATRHGRQELHGCNSQLAARCPPPQDVTLRNRGTGPATTYPMRATTQRETATVVLGRGEPPGGGDRRVDGRPADR